MDNRIMTLLEQLSDKLGTTADHLYKVLVKQAKIDAIICFVQLFFLLLCVIPLVIGWEWVIPHCVPMNPKSEYHFEREWPGEIQISVFILGGLTLGLTIGLLVQFMNLIECCFKNLLNPEASAIEKIFTQITKP